MVIQFLWKSKGVGKARSALKKRNCEDSADVTTPESLCDLIRAARCWCRSGLGPRRGPGWVESSWMTRVGHKSRGKDRIFNDGVGRTE